MKNLFNGMKRSKARTILSVVIVLIMTATIGVCTYMSASTSMRGRGADSPDMQYSQHIDNDTDDLSTNATEENTFGEDESGNKSVIPENKGKGQNTIWIIADAATFVIGAILLFAVNFASTKKRGKEFSQIISNGVPFKAIKKQLFLEAFVIVLIIGLIGGGIGVAVAQPISNAIMTQNMPQGSDTDDMHKGFEGGKPQGDFNPDGEKGNAPEDFDNENIPMPEDFDNENMPERPQDDDSMQKDNGDFSHDNFKNSRQGGSTGYIMSAIATVVSAVAFAIISGIACYLPVKKIKSEEKVNE